MYVLSDFTEGAFMAGVALELSYSSTTKEQSALSEIAQGWSGQQIAFNVQLAIKHAKAVNLSVCHFSRPSLGQSRSCQDLPWTMGS